MPLFTVEVEVALRRPPRTDQVRRFVVEARNGLAAELLAVQWAEGAPHPYPGLRPSHVVMAVASTVIDWEDTPDA